MKEWIPSDWGRYAAVGVQLAAGVLLGIFIGYWIDKELDRFPLFTALCALIGTILGFYNLYVQLKDG